MPVIECTRLAKRFGRVQAVNDLGLSLDAGAVLGFIGPNGAGKSTTIRMMLGLSAPTAGAVRVFGEDPRTSHRQRARIGYAPGELRLDDRLTVAGTLALWERLRGGVDVGYRDQLVERLGVDPSRRVRTLSTGNRRKVALVGALMARPALLVLDEPTNGLDPLVQNEFMTILGEAAESGASVLLSSHVLSEVERVADTIAVIRAGSIVAHGPTAELRRGAAQLVRVVFAASDPSAPRPARPAGATGPAPAAEVLAEVRALAGTVSADQHGEREIRIHWSGPPRPLLAVLAHHELESFTVPEPDLETAFLAFYRTDGDRPDRPREDGDVVRPAESGPASWVAPGRNEWSASERVAPRPRRAIEGGPR